ncbi:MAG TPA: hypothetical protein DCS93_13975 [Microscillaceae bacterium]|nr:hypothetical protein [Microscillaceae bacterium]
MRAFLKHERKELERFRLLPYTYKKVGLVIGGLSLLTLIGVWATNQTVSPLIKNLLKDILLFAMLLVSVTREKQENAAIRQARWKSYTFAFVAGVGYAIVQPYINYGVAYLVKPEKAVFSEMSLFVVLWFMLVVQLATYYVFKRTQQSDLAKAC